MHIITKRDQIKTVYGRWAKQYPKGSMGEDKDEITKKLGELNFNTCSSKDIDDIIGNSTWTELECDQCKRSVDLILRLGEAPDYESTTFLICKDCLESVTCFIKGFEKGRQQ